MQIERNARDLLESVLALALELLQIVDKDYLVTAAQRGRKDILHRPAACGDHLQIQRRNLTLQPDDALHFLLRQLALVDVPEVHDRTVGDQAVGQLGGRGLKAVKADLCALRHVRRHLQAKRGLARRRTARKNDKIAVVTVQPRVQFVQTVGDEFPLGRLVVVEFKHCVHHADNLCAATLSCGSRRLRYKHPSLRTGAARGKLCGDFVQAVDAGLLLHGADVGAPRSRRRRHVHALHEQVVVCRAANAADRDRVHRTPSREQLFGCLVDRAELRHGEVILVRHRQQFTGDFRRKQQTADYAVLRVQRCFCVYHCS